MVVEKPSGSKPTSPTMEPSSAGGLFRKGMDAERSAIMLMAGAAARPTGRLGPEKAVAVMAVMEIMAAAAASDTLRTSKDRATANSEADDELWTTQIWHLNYRSHI
eukprot:6188084-Pleurochrysis_carterae.AAC.2